MEFVLTNKARAELARIFWRYKVLNEGGVEFLLQFAKSKERDVGPQLEPQYQKWCSERKSEMDG